MTIIFALMVVLVTLLGTVTNLYILTLCTCIYPGSYSHGDIAIQNISKKAIDLIEYFQSGGSI